MTFEEWWSSYWKPVDNVGNTFNLAFKEVAENAWNAAKRDMKSSDSILKSEDVK